jgi:hypothetical protein
MLYSGPHESIRFHNRQSVFMFNFPCLPNGRDKRRCILLLQSVVDGLPAGVVVRDSSNIIHSSGTFLPGDYFVESDLTITCEISDITPVADIGPRFPIQIIPLLVQHALEACRKTAQFRFDLIQRDQVCVLSGASRDLIGSHIVAHAWFQNGRNRLDRLPHTISDGLALLPNFVHDRRNGLMLSAGLSAGFDTGGFTIVLNAFNQYEVVALKPHYLSFDGYLL